MIPCAPDPSPNDRPRTLRDVLYAGQPEAAASEDEWASLVAETAGGNQQAFAEIYSRTHRLVFTLITRIVHSRETAEEVALDVYLGVWQRAGTYDRGTGSVLAWIMNLARSRAIDRLRHDTRVKRTNPLPHRGASDNEIIDLTGRRHMEDVRRELERALCALTPDERDAIEGAYFRDATYEDVAERLRQPLGTIKTRIRSALAKLRAALSGRRDEL
jgi:RNA polymerase sigma-70 factor (ECF subfamily)